MCPLAEEQNKQLREGNISELQEFFQALLSVPLYSFVICLIDHKLSVGQVACTLAIIAAQLKHSLANTHNSVCVWYWQKCSLASDPPEGSCHSCCGCASSWPCLAELCWGILGENCVLWRRRRVIVGICKKHLTALVKIKSCLLASKFKIL